MLGCPGSLRTILHLSHTILGHLTSPIRLPPTPADQRAFKPPQRVSLFRHTQEGTFASVLGRMSLVFLSCDHRSERFETHFVRQRLFGEVFLM